MEIVPEFRDTTLSFENHVFMLSKLKTADIWRSLRNRNDGVQDDWTTTGKLHNVIITI